VVDCDLERCLLQDLAPMRLSPATSHCWLRSSRIGRHPSPQSTTPPDDLRPRGSPGTGSCFLRQQSPKLLARSVRRWAQRPGVAPPQPTPLDHHHASEIQIALAPTKCPISDIFNRNSHLSTGLRTCHNQYDDFTTRHIQYDMSTLAYAPEQFGLVAIVWWHAKCRGLRTRPPRLDDKARAIR
jgi:hypothetical protein